MHITNSVRNFISRRIAPISRAVRRYITSLCLTVSDKRHLLLFRKNIPDGIFVSLAPRACHDTWKACPVLALWRALRSTRPGSPLCASTHAETGHVALRLSYSRVRQTTLSTCPVIGNISKGLTSFVSKPNSRNLFTSRASVVGLHEI